jgi:hypothetical protein
VKYGSTTVLDAETFEEELVTRGFSKYQDCWEDAVLSQAYMGITKEGKKEKFAHSSMRTLKSSSQMYPFQNL